MPQAYRGVPHITTPGGWDVRVTRFPVGADEVPIVAVLGRGGMPTRWCTIGSAFSHADGFDEFACVAAMAAWGALVLGPEVIRWRVAEAGTLVTNRKRAKKLVRAIHPREFRGTAVPAVSGDREVSLPELLRQYTVAGESNAVEVAELAELGFPPGMYGQPSDEARIQVRQRMVHFGEQLKAQLLSGAETFGADLLQAEIDRCTGEAEIDSLAAWVELLIQGRRDFHFLHRSLQREAVEDTRCNGSRRLQEVMASPLHRLFYDPVPQFGDATFTWSAENGRSLTLRVPVAVDMGLVHLGRPWWNSLLKAYQSEDSEAKDVSLGKLSSLLSIDVHWKAIGSPDFTTDSDSREILAEYAEYVAADSDEGDSSAPDLDEILAKAALTSHERLVVEEVVLKKRKAKDVAARLNVSPGPSLPT